MCLYLTLISSSGSSLLDKVSTLSNVPAVEVENASSKNNAYVIHDPTPAHSDKTITRDGCAFMTTPAVTLRCLFRLTFNALFRLTLNYQKGSPREFLRSLALPSSCRPTFLNSFLLPACIRLQACLVMATELSPPIDPLDRLPLEIWNECIFPFGAAPQPPALPLRELQVVPRSQGARAGRACQACTRLAIVVDVGDIIPEDMLAGREEGLLRCIAISPFGGVVPLPQLTFPPDWRPDMNGGGFRTAGGLVAYFCEGYC